MRRIVMCKMMPWGMIVCMFVINVNLQAELCQFMDNFDDGVFDPVWGVVKQYPFAIEEIGGEVRIHGRTVEDGWASVEHDVAVPFFIAPRLAKEVRCMR